MSETLDRDEDLVGDLEDEGGAKLTDLLAEHRLIGYLLLHAGSITEVRDLVSPREFYDRALGRVFEHLVAADGLFNNGDVVTWLAGADVAGRRDNQAVGYLISQGADISTDRASALAQHLFEIAERRYTQEGETNLIGLDAWQSKMGALLYSDRASSIFNEGEYLVEDLIPEREIVIVMGETQTGKSFLTSHLGLCIARGKEFFGRRVLEPRPVIWCCYEGGRGARGRLLAFSNFFDAQADIPFAALTDPFDLWQKEENVEELIKEIDALCRVAFNGRRPGAVIIDTHNAANSGASEIDSEVVSKIRDRYKRVVRALETTVILVGHTNALGKHRGNEQLTNNVPTVLTVSYKTRVENRQTIQTKDNDGRPVRTLGVQKQREGETGATIDFVLHGVETGIKNKFGKMRTSCVVTEPNWTQEPEKEEAKKPDTKGGFRLTDIEDLFFDVLWKQLHEAGMEAPPELQLPRGTRVVHRASVSKAYRDSSIPQDGTQPISDNTVKSRWDRSSRRLRKFNVIGFKEPYFWWTGKPIVGKPATQQQRSMFDDYAEPDLPEAEFPE